MMARALKETSLRSLTITIIRKATILENASSQKTSCSLGNFYVDDFYLGSLKAYTLYLVPGPVSGKTKH